MWNLYGPTETNVCTAYPIPATIPADRDGAVPDRHGLPAAACPGGRRTRPRRRPGTLGELVIAGPGVMRGYFGQPELTAAAFLVDDDGTRWYRTGDLVSDDGAGCFQFHGRRDRMVKKRGYRIELGEIESALYRHDGVDRAGVVARAGRSGRLDRRVRRAQARPEEVDHRHEAALHRSTCPTTWSPTRSRSSTTCRRPRPTRSITSAWITGRRTRTTLVRRRITPGPTISLSTRRLRRILSWKFVFYDAAPARAAWHWGRRAATRSSAFWAGWRWRYGRGGGTRLRAALERAGAALDADWSIETTWPALAANTARFLARDYPLDCQTDEAVLSRFDVRGYERLRATLAEGRGAILVGSHLGAHIAGVHWLFRRGVPLRLLVQRPRHVSASSTAGSTPAARIRRPNCSSAATSRRPWPSSESSAPGAALRDGLAIYLNGDIPWSGPNTCPGTLLGRPQRLLAIWTELAVLTHARSSSSSAPTAPAGRFALEIEPSATCGPARRPSPSPITSSSSRAGSRIPRPTPSPTWSGRATSRAPDAAPAPRTARTRRRKVISTAS